MARARIEPNRSQLALRVDQLDTETLRLSAAHLLALAENRGSDPACEAAFDRLYQACNPLFRKLANSRAHSYWSADDRVQDLWETMLERFPDFDPERGPFPAWLHKVVRNVLNVEDRDSRLWRQLDEELGLRVPSREEDPAAACEELDDRMMLRAALEQVRHHISETNYKILQSHLVDDKSYADIAAGLGLTAKRVRDRYNRALVSIKAKLAGLR
jgi:RNA polymerase sigma factor (sigma-70 family)